MNLNTRINNMSPRRMALVLFVICAAVMLPFLGLAEYNTKGEPREAVVAYSIIESGNWILPTNNGGEMPYKPPFFHWCIAAASMLNGGHVDEYTSRLPSAIALIAMTVATFCFYVRRKNASLALAAALVTFTTFELHRAGANCRVDMVLTALTVGAIFKLYDWWERGMRCVPWLAILLMSLGTLTKGPVGSIIPCLVVGCFMLMRGVNFFKAFFLMLAWGALSLVLPLVWYMAAYQQGGQEFLDLVMEENFGRMTSTMSYDSCVNPWPYNVKMLIAGFVPWTLGLIFMLFACRLKKCDGDCSLRRLWTRIKNFDAVNVLSAVAVAVIFVFYCIPQSKRSVYLMPLYPFAAYFVAMFFAWASQRKLSLAKAFGDVIAATAALLFIAFIIVKVGVVPDSIFGHGRHAATNVAMLHALADSSGVAAWLWAAVSPLGAVAWWFFMRRRVSPTSVVCAISVVIMTIYISMAGIYQPAVLNVKSVKDIAAEINRIAPEAEGRIYEFIEHGEFAAGDPVHYFEIDFYIGDRMASFYKQRPQSGFLLMGDEDAKKYLPQFTAEGYDFEPIYSTPRPVLGQPATLYRFIR